MLKFVEPVRSGDRLLHERITILEKRTWSKPGRGIFKNLIEVINDRGGVTLPCCTPAPDIDHPRCPARNSRGPLLRDSGRLLICSTNHVKRYAASRVGHALANLPLRARWFPQGDVAAGQPNGPHESLPSSGCRWRAFCCLVQRLAIHQQHGLAHLTGWGI